MRSVSQDEKLCNSSEFNNKCDSENNQNDSENSECYPKT